MGKKFVSVTLDLDADTLKILERASAKRGSTVSHVAKELISKALHELIQSREDVLSVVEETLRVVGPDNGEFLDKLRALTRKEITQEEPRPMDGSCNEAQMALLVVEAGTEVFSSEHDFLEWLKYPAIALGKKTPLSLLSSPDGLRMVVDLLVRIDYGVPL